MVRSGLAMTCDKTSEQQRAALQSQIFKIAND
ncbi:hypothetical protein BMETH_2707254346949, partial [methanotrophic bacterial endosymbiont of Bathymodiolus sp.]